MKKTVPVETDGEKIQLSMDSIIYAETVDRKTYVYDDKKIYVYKESLVKLEQLLAHGSFLRVSKTTILNMHHLYSIKPYVNHRLLATLSNNETLLISRSYIKNLKEYLKDWED